MYQNTKFSLALLLLLAGSGLISAAGKAEEPRDNLPLSRQATFVESYSPSEWTVRAAGLGEGKKKQQEGRALLDARKCAVYFCLFMGTDPLLTTDEEKKRFAAVEQTFFDAPNVMRFIAWEAQEFSLRVRSSDKKQLKIEKTFRVNVGLMREDLRVRGVMLGLGDLSVEFGSPQILVLPEVARGENPLQALETQPELKHAARALESYLTARRYDVLAPEQQEFLNDYDATMRLIENEEDLSHKIALALGADVYITFALNLDQKYVGSTENNKAAVSVRAFETTTARLLGSETGYSPSRPATDEAVIEEGMHDAVEKVLARINAYWKEDLQRGAQYKLVFKIADNFDGAQVEKIQSAIAAVVGGIAPRNKEIIATDRTLDYLIWVTPDKQKSARELYVSIREAFALQIPGAAIEKQQLNRKLLLLQVASR